MSYAFSESRVSRMFCRVLMCAEQISLFTGEPGIQ
jgi:hypothetical protein